MHLRVIFSAAVAVMACSAGHISAQSGKPGQPAADYKECVARAHANTVQVGMCAQAELTRQDTRLNTAYQALLTSLGEGSPVGASETDRQQALREEERAWLADRDQVCRLNHDTVDNVCLIQRESARADELEARLRRRL